MSIQHQVRPKFRTRNEEIVAGLMEESGGSPPIDPYIAIKRKTAEVACAMALIHGGDYRIEIDHEDGSVVVRRRCPPRPT
jgi:hypothetical protein